VALKMGRRLSLSISDKNIQVGGFLFSLFLEIAE